MHKLTFDTRARCEMRDITPELRAFTEHMAREHGRRHGALALFCPHTTCGLTVNEGADPDVRRDMLAFFSPVGIESLVKNFPDFKQGEIAVATFGANTTKAAVDAGLRVDIEVPRPEAPSMPAAIDIYMREQG